MDEKICVYYLCVYETKASVDSITADWEPKQAYCMITNDNCFQKATLFSLQN